MGVSRVAMQFDDLVIWNARVLMQSIDVLRDDRRRFADPDQLRYSAMTAIRNRLTQNRLHRETPAPSFPPCVVGANEIRESDWCLLGPNTTRAAEVRNAGLGADTCA